ncbi:uncharacterized protein LOC119595570 [Penaeus monodon]|uniref:uncharacterized protein LOC119595570 n=1 Tax=Penaeus monodon TaxID=6687 RepID=UPI0018A77A2F|nr:uncharacterized protein LOC119595570 [Penaeus monodon]
MLMFLQTPFVHIYLRNIDLPSSSDSMTSPILCACITASDLEIHLDWYQQRFTSKFNYVHVDLFGPLPYSNGYRYILTCIDRFTRWPEAIPLADIHADTVARAFIAGIRSSLISDLGSTSVKLVMEHQSGYLVNYSAVPLAPLPTLPKIM